MRSWSLFLSFFFVLPAYGAKTTKTQHAVVERINTMTSTNNASVFLKKIASQISTEQSQDFKKLLGKKTHFQARRVSPLSVAIQFSDHRWVKFTFDLKNQKFLVGKKAFQWKLQTSTKDNLNRLATLINQQYPPAKKKSAWWAPFPKAQAWSLFGNDEDEAALVVAGTAAVNQPFMGLDSFLTSVELHCEMRNGLPSRSREAYFAEANRNQLRRDFAEAKEAVGYNNAAHAYGLWVNTNLIGRFHEAQTCLRDRNYIRNSDLLPIEYNEQNRTGRISH